MAQFVLIYTEVKEKGFNKKSRLIQFVNRKAVRVVKCFKKSTCGYYRVQNPLDIL